MKKCILFSVLILCSFIALQSCKKDSYFVNDEGISKAKYDGSILDYLKEKHQYFDTLVAIINYAGMNDVFEKDSITFFAPPDSTIKRSISLFNFLLANNGMTPINSYKQIKPSTWKKLLSMYILKGRRTLNSFSQIDIANLLAFPGQYYRSYNNTLLNIGVVFTDLESTDSKGNVINSIQYQGYRYLSIAYVESEAAPTIGRQYAQVASSDIQPNNGVIHVISINGFGDYDFPHYFGFSIFQFVNSALNDGIVY